MKKLRLSVLGRLLVLFLGILLPISISGAWIILSANSKLEKEISKSMQQNVENFSEVFDKQLSDINMTSLSIIAQSRVQLLARQNSRTKYETYTSINIMREFMTNMTNIQNPNYFIDNVRVYLPRLGKAFNADGYVKGSLQELSDEEYQALLDVKNRSGNLIYFEDRLITLNTLTLQNPRSMIEVEFNLSNLSKYFSSPLIYSGSFYLFTLPDQNFFLSNMSEEKSSQLLSMTADSLTKVTEYRFAEDPSTSYRIFLSTLPSMGGTYTLFIPQNQLMQPSIFSTRYVLILLFVMLLGVLVFFGGAYNLIHKPLHKLILAFKALGEDNDFHMRVTTSESTDFSYLYNAFNKMAEQLYKLIYQDYYQGMLLQKANLKQLQAQINPHFLYNSYFMLYRMIKSEQHEESKIVAKELGTYFQYITRNDADAVTLLDEYTHAKIYSNIQSVRFGNRIRVEFAELPEKCSSFEVPKLVLQPIVENAFNYGLENKVCDGLLRVGFSERENGLVISVEDNGESLSDEALAEIQSRFVTPGIDGMQGEITGLVNIYKRLQIFFRRDDVLSVSRSPLGGMSVQVFIHEQGAEAKDDVPTSGR